MKIVLDTNVLVSGIFWGGPPSKILEAWHDQGIVRDPDDNKFIDCAISGRAPFLVSGDEDLLVLKKVMSVEILNPRQFLHKFL